MHHISYNDYKFETYAVNGIAEGKFKVYKKNKLIIEGNYRSGRTDGKKIFYKEGEKYKEEIYKMGKLIDTQKL